jgi:hypothetical protein
MVRDPRATVSGTKPTHHNSVSAHVRIGPPQIEIAKQWVTEKYPYNNYHLLKSLEWLDRIAPGSAQTVRMATLSHDMERAFGGPDQPVAGPGRMNDPEYYKAHSERSARIVGAWLREQSIDEADAIEVEELIRLHEVGGNPEANLVQAADSLSFLETNIDLFLNMLRSGRRTLGEVAGKFDETYERIQVPRARELAAPMYHVAKSRLELLQAEMAAGQS